MAIDAGLETMPSESASALSTEVNQVVINPVYASRQEELLSQSAAKAFYELGLELYSAAANDPVSIKQAVIFLTAALNLDKRATYVLPDIIEIAWRYPQDNFSDAIKIALDEYVDRSADLEITSKAVGYLLDSLDSREQRQELLLNLLNRYQQKNIMFASDLNTQLGFLAAETGDTVEAQTYLARAFAQNKYNRLAFAKLVELSDAAGQPLPDISYLENLRFAIKANPLDFDSAFSFAAYAQMVGLDDVAASAYQYCSDLLKYLSGLKSVGPTIYRPWILSCYAAGRYDRCQDILREVRQQNVFDVQVEAIAAEAAKEAGNIDSYEEILNSIQNYAGKIATGQLKTLPSNLEDLAWFYSFVADANAEQALVWATKAYDADQNSLNAASLFAYALVMNNQNDLASSILNKINVTTQSAALAKAEILIQREDVNSATDLLKQVIRALPASFEARRAAARLEQINPEYKPLNDSLAIRAELQKNFGRAVIGKFSDPAKKVALELQVKSSVFPYSSEIIGNLLIINKSDEAMLISPDAMIKGNIRVDVKIAGDLNRTISALIVKTIRPSYEIMPGGTLLMPLRLDIGEVKQILDCHPQAELNLEYMAYIDPRIDPNGKIKNSLPIEPARIFLKRPKLGINTGYLQQRFDALKKGLQGQKIRAAQLFAGLLAEQQEFRETGAAYRFVYTEPELLTSALARCLAEKDWVLNVRTMAAISKVKFDYRLVSAVSDKLEDTSWPVRLMAVFVLYRNQKEEFKPVLNWIAKNDNHPLVKQLAEVLAAIPDANGVSVQSSVQPKK